ncbi:hypothetical protein MPPM_2093 [Methylorubrum populi]|uniref:Nucleotidyl transferase n=1 Tax=Methylorubrum populi TaxID=223967 RepID=A0A169QYR8_9HYPH|nr:hypothetical protein [Methylorubrum populi]BAU90698.1 hypothetical protein MPPM_2093 [Methylorubrum populi]
MAPAFDRTRLLQALERLGADLSARGLFVELAVYGGGALMLQFAWRRGTDDVDAVVREGFDEAALAPSVGRVAEQMGLPPDWLNNAVGMFTPLDEDESLFAAAGLYPAEGTPGLRTFVATPRYLLAMKLHALRNVDRGDRDLRDARQLAAHLGIRDAQALHDLYVSVYDEAPADETSLRFRSVLQDPPR